MIEPQGEPARLPVQLRLDRLTTEQQERPRKDTIRRIKRSPDDADALLAFYDNAPADLGSCRG